MDPRLAALVVHDLKNAMGGLEARLDALQRAHPGPESLTALNDCRALRRQFIQFLMLYGSDRQLRAHASDESPLSLLEALARDTQAAHPGLQLSVRDADQAPPFWYYDPRLVRMALDAALHNALRFARRQVQLHARADGPYLVLGVDDDGPGLSTDAADPDAAHATGLGTALCQAVAAAHRQGPLSGRCTLANRPEGGARFELWLA